ncbi:MAG: cation:proton antiporter, partial [Nanoarchaeota archaeon]
MLEIFGQLSIILIIATAVAAIAKLLRQPLIISYIFTGILVSPYFFNIIPEGDAIETFIHIGISFLLFMVGLSLNPKIIKDVGKPSIITGLGQVFFTSFFGFLISLLLGFSIVEGLYIAVALTFSSTIIIMKLLYDKGDLETLYGRISVGFLIVQDLVVVFALLFISSMSKEMTFFSIFINSILPIFAIIILIGLFSYFLLQHVVQMMAKSQELLLLFSVAWCFFLAALFAAFNFSMEMGALIAGVSLAMSPFRYEISAKMKPLRDFFLILFFISLGSKIVFGDVMANLPAIIIFSFFILIGNPVIVMTLMGLMGYTKRTGFMAGLTVAQISEFSLILVSLGVSVGHLSQEILSTVTLVGLLTISGSSYMITYSNLIYSKISKYLSVFERKGKKVDEQKYHHEDAYNLILFGCNRMGMNMLSSLGKKK